MNKLKQFLLPKFSREECKNRGFHVTTAQPIDGKYRAFTKNFKLGDEVYFLGHDGVGGFWYGDIITADEELMRKKENLHFYKMIGRLKN